MGTTDGARTRYRGGRPWPEKCEGPGKYQHAKGCHPKRPKCRWRRKLLPNRQVCECGMIPYPHRIGSVDWKHGGVCVHHPEFDRIMFEMTHLQDWETGESLDPEEVCYARYAWF